MKSVPERLVVQFDKHGKEEQETETRTAGESLLDCYLYVICVCYLALGQKTSAPARKRGTTLSSHNNLVSLGLCCERSRLAIPPWWSHAIKSLSGRMFPFYSP